MKRAITILLLASVGPVWAQAHGSKSHDRQVSLGDQSTNILHVRGNVYVTNIFIVCVVEARALSQDCKNKVYDLVQSNSGISSQILITAAPTTAANLLASISYGTPDTGLAPSSFGYSLPPSIYGATNDVDATRTTLFTFLSSNPGFTGYSSFVGDVDISKPIVGLISSQPSSSGYSLPAWMYGATNDADAARITLSPSLSSNPGFTGYSSFVGDVDISKPIVGLISSQPSSSGYSLPAWMYGATNDADATRITLSAFLSSNPGFTGNSSFVGDVDMSKPIVGLISSQPSSFGYSLPAPSSDNAAAFSTELFPQPNANPGLQVILGSSSLDSSQ